MNVWMKLIKYYDVNTLNQNKIAHIQFSLFLVNIVYTMRAKKSYSSLMVSKCTKLPSNDPKITTLCGWKLKQPIIWKYHQTSSPRKRKSSITNKKWCNFIQKHHAKCKICLWHQLTMAKKFTSTFHWNGLTNWKIVTVAFFRFFWTFLKTSAQIQILWLVFSLVILFNAGHLLTVWPYSKLLTPENSLGRGNECLNCCTKRNLFKFQSKIMVKTWKLIIPKEPCLCITNTHVHVSPCFYSK